jgi:hypothetical protein
MQVHLVVVRAFAGYAKGAIIADAATMMQVLAGEHVRNVVRVTVKGA